MRKFEKAGSTATRFSPRRDALRMGERDPLPGSRCQVLGPGRAVSWEMPLQIPDLALWPALVVHLGAGLKRQAAKLPLAACRPCCRPRRGRRVGKAWRSSAEGGTGEDGRCTHSGRARPSRGLTVSRSDQAAATEAPGAGRRPEASPSRGRRVGGDAGAANSFPGGGSRGFPFRVGSESAKIGFPSGWSKALRFSESVSESRRGPSVAFPFSRATRGPAAHSGRAGQDPDPAFQDNGDQVSRVTGPADNGTDDNRAGKGIVKTVRVESRTTRVFRVRMQREPSRNGHRNRSVKRAGRARVIDAAPARSCGAQRGWAAGWLRLGQFFLRV